jgi:hypothetical protein
MCMCVCIWRMLLILPAKDQTRQAVKRRMDYNTMVVMAIITKERLCVPHCRQSSITSEDVYTTLFINRKVDYRKFHILWTRSILDNFI